MFDDADGAQSGSHSGVFNRAVGTEGAEQGCYAIGQPTTYPSQVSVRRPVPVYVRGTDREYDQGLE